MAPSSAEGRIRTYDHSPWKGDVLTRLNYSRNVREAHRLISSAAGGI